MSHIKGIVFDKDGTLFDFNATWATWAQTFLVDLAQGDRAQAAALGQAIGFDMASGAFDAASVAIAGTPTQIARALAPHMGGLSVADLATRMNTAAANAPQAEVTPLIPFLTGLKGRGLKLGVATNDGDRPARAHLDKARILSAFDFVAGSDSGYGAKPDAGQLQAFCKAVGLAPEDCLMVGDSTHDLAAGRSAGMTTCGVLTGLAARDVLAPMADLVLDSIAVLPGALDG
ncbi:HAD family hydrolase [Nereida sp. MMG024]|nr:HAD family hydrolase [Nereida sp. MMG025]MCF6445111.1 HAD family hydrolase [Nereida sp. MMG025]